MKRFLLTLSTVIAGLLLRKNIFDAIDTYIVVPLFSNLTSSIINDYLFGATIAAITAITIYVLKKKKRIANWTAANVTLLFSIYIYIRFVSNSYDLFAFYHIPWLKYSDVTIWTFVLIIGIKISNWCNPFKEPIYKSIPFIIDSPIKDSSQDLFSRNQFAELLANKIQSKVIGSPSQSVAIGISGPWGSGKTSFMNLIRTKIDTKNRIVIDFNPWRSSSPERIIEDFFELLIDEVKNYDPTLSNDLLKYAKTLSKIDENILSKSVDIISDFILDGKNKNMIYNDLNNSIESIKKQIIIFIDDIDRLDKKEIVEVLRIIRNTADFRNVTYIVSYDKGYVLNAIKDFNSHRYQTFLEKIFQFEFSLPPFDTSKLRKEIKDELIKTLVYGT